MDIRTVAACAIGVAALVGLAIFRYNPGSVDARVCEITSSLTRDAKYKVKTSQGDYIINRGADSEVLRAKLLVDSMVKITYGSGSYSMVVIQDVAPIADDPSQKCP